MSADMSTSQEMRQFARAIPEQIIAGEILQMTRMDLERHLLAQFEANPALSLEEIGLCPACHAQALRYPCPFCGHTPAAEDVPVILDEDRETARQRLYESEGWEPFDGVAARRTLREDLRAQWTLEESGPDAAAGAYIIECLDEDGYLTEPMLDIAQRFRLSVPQAEAVLRRVQTLEPAGVGARNLRECLTLQCARAESCDSRRALAARILDEAWDELCARDIAGMAHCLGVAPDEADESLDWIRNHLTPHPGEARRDPWERLAPRAEPRVATDAVIREGPDGFIVEIVESARFHLGVDPAYERAYRALAHRSGALPADLDHVRRSVANARFLMDGLLQRRRTLHRVLSAVATAQADFLRYGRARLKPLMQKEIAARTGLHESTVCRALADKMVRLPSGETVPASAFFDASMPAKEAIVEIVGREDPKKPLSDARIAQLLAAEGFPIARRTVAKYREALRIPPVDARAV